MKSLLIAAFGIIPGLTLGIYGYFKIVNIFNLYLAKIAAIGAV